MSAVHPVLQLDIQGADFLAALGYCLMPGATAEAERRLHARWGDPAYTLATTTLRSGLDLYLQALELPAGSEVLMSAITHPDMVEVVRHLGLVPVPVDIDPATMAPDMDALLNAVSDKSCVLVVAQLFGGHFPLDQVVEVCRANGIKLVEDCAQTFGGGYAGHPDADISLFSFGPLKTRTALAGALMTVRDGATRDRMAALQAAYPEMGRADFAQRVLKYAVIRFLCSDARRWGRLCNAIARSGRDPNAVVRSWTRSLNGAFRIERFRVRPGAPLLRLLERRLREGDRRDWVARRAQVGAKLAARVAGVERLGAGCREPLHWLFPVVVANPAGTLARLFAGGFQAAPGLSNLDTFAPPADRPETTPLEARRILDGALILPMHPSLGDADLDRLADLLVSADAPAAKPVASAV